MTPTSLTPPPISLTPPLVTTEPQPGQPGATLPPAPQPIRPAGSTLAGRTIKPQDPFKPLSVDRLYHGPKLSGQVPLRFQFTPSGKSVTYLAPKDHDPDTLHLWEYDLETNKKKILVDAEHLEKGTLSEEDKAARERKRMFEGGIIEYIWSRDGESLLFPVDGQLYLYKGGSLRQLTRKGTYQTDPAFSGDGKKIAFVRNQDLYILDLQTSEEKRLTTDGMSGFADFIAAEELERHKGYWWSPDSRRIAFCQVNEENVEVVQRSEITTESVKVVSQKYPKAGSGNAIVKLGVVDVESGKTAWIHLAEEDSYLARVDWLPDGKQVAVQVLSRDQQSLKVLFADPVSGDSKTVLHIKSNTWINLHDDLHFLSERKQFIFATEESGYKHFNLYDYDGNKVCALTHGNWNVSSLVSINEKTGRFTFTGFADTPLEKHLYAASLEGSGDPKRLTKESGWHSIVSGKEGAFFLDHFSNSTTPPRLSIIDASGERVGWIEENRLDNDHPFYPYLAGYSEPVFGTLAADDGTDLHFRLILPKNFDERKKYPVLIHTYGGPHFRLVKNQWIDNQWLQLMAQKGFVIFTLDNRGSSDRGAQFEGAIKGELGNVEVEDQVSGVKYLKTLSFVDSEHIGVFGWSYGGFMSLMLAVKHPEHFHSCVSVAPVTEWEQYDTAYTERYLGKPQDNPEGYAKSSVFSYIHRQMANTLIIHGMSDDNVLYTNTAKLMAKMQEAEISFETMPYPGHKHSISGNHQRVHLYKHVTSYLERQLKTKEG